LSNDLYIEPQTPSKRVNIIRRDGEREENLIDSIAVEEPLEIRVRGRAISVTMRTPGHDEDLAIGFLLTEGVITRPADVLRVEACERNEFGNVINVVLAPEVHVDFDRLTRHVFASSSCGLCGKTTIEATQTRHPPVTSDLVVDYETIAQMPQTMRAAQSTFDETGGLHAAALFDPSGKLLALREDVGRHNAVDKIIGGQVQSGEFPLDQHILLVSGRTSFEILQKALAARIPIIAAVSAPSSLAVEFARSSGQTLIGFLRGRKMNVYAGTQRLRASVDCSAAAS